MIQRLICTIPHKTISYDIELNRGILKDQEALINALIPFGSRFAIITDEVIRSLYGDQLLKSLSSSGLEAYLFSFPKGESHKTRAAKEHLENRLFEKRLGRDICVIALGGGVATDLGGFVAATYCRGVPLVMIPTSLLGMVDASMGGKTGVDVPYGKNLVGAIYQPKKILIDSSTLVSLPLNELKNGIVEMIKHGLIADANYFDFLEKNSEPLLARNLPLLETAIYESCRIKKEIVEQDEKEEGKRRLLNFGHTIGHALELLTHYSIAHGEAVAIGLLVESHLSAQLGHLKQKSLDRIYHLLQTYGLTLSLPRCFSVQAILKTMQLDKKSVRGKARFVMIDEIGSPLPFDSHYCIFVEENLIQNSLEWMNNDLCRY